MKNMKKVLFLMLFLVVLGAANVNSQVRIGGDGEPHTAAVLDLNVDDDTDTGTKGLALPRVSLASNDDLLGYSDLLEGMLVYNTNADITGGDGVGVYYWDGNEWVKSAGSAAVPDGSITTSKLADGAVTENKLAKYVRTWTYTCTTCSALTVGTYTSIKFESLGTPVGCDQSNMWAQNGSYGGYYQTAIDHNGLHFLKIINSTLNPYARLFCYV